jgi:hypothetical protein
MPASNCLVESNEHVTPPAKVRMSISQSHAAPSLAWSPACVRGREPQRRRPVRWATELTRDDVRLHSDRVAIPSAIAVCDVVRRAVVPRRDHRVRLFAGCVPGGDPSCVQAVECAIRTRAAVARSRWCGRRRWLRRRRRRSNRRRLSPSRGRSANRRRRRRSRRRCGRCSSRFRRLSDRSRGRPSGGRDGRLGCLRCRDRDRSRLTAAARENDRNSHCQECTSHQQAASLSASL